MALAPVSVIGRLDADALQSHNFDFGAESPEDASGRLGGVFTEVLEVMRENKLFFDDGRLALVQRQMAAMGVDATGMPTDPKIFTFDNAQADGYFGETPSDFENDEPKVHSNSRLVSPKVLVKHVAVFAVIMMLLFWLICPLSWDMARTPVTSMCREQVRHHDGAEPSSSWTAWICWGLVPEARLGQGRNNTKFLEFRSFQSVPLGK